MLSQSGASSIEYGLIAGLIAVALIAAIPQIGDMLSSWFMLSDAVFEQLPT
ncbi:MAG: Flp family type IVb pilin [Pseudomonadota bacterium]